MSKFLFALSALVAFGLGSASTFLYFKPLIVDGANHTVESLNVVKALQPLFEDAARARGSGDLPRYRQALRRIATVHEWIAITDQGKLSSTAQVDAMLALVKLHKVEVSLGNSEASKQALDAALQHCISRENQTCTEAEMLKLESAFDDQSTRKW